MQAPLHPMIVHFPMAMTFLLPVLIVIFAVMIRKNKMTPKSWLIIVGLQLTLVVTGYVALETGETEEATVGKAVAKALIHEHEEAAEIFVGSTVLSLVLSVGAFFVRREIGFLVKLGVAGLSLVSCFLAYRTGTLGGELTYTHGAAAVYLHGEEDGHGGNLPEPIINTTPSSSTDEENESLKADENDYGSADELNSNDDDLKQED